MDDWIDVREQATIIRENTENCRTILNNTYSIIYLNGNNLNGSAEDLLQVQRFGLNIISIKLH